VLPAYDCALRCSHTFNVLDARGAVSVTERTGFIQRVRRSPQNVAYRQHDSRRNVWVDLTWAQMNDQVARWQAALAGEGLQAGDRVAVMLRNCPEWVMFDQAAMSLGLVVVPLYTVDRPENVAYIANNAGVKVLLFENMEQWRALRMVREQLNGMVRMVSLDVIPDAHDALLRPASAWLPPYTLNSMHVFKYLFMLRMYLQPQFLPF